MQIAVAAAGSEGDVLPFVALARGLRNAGHDVWLIIPDHFRRFAGEVPVRANGAAPRSVANHGPLPRLKNPIARMRLAAADLADCILPTVPSVSAAMKGAGLLIHHHMDVAAFAAAEAQQIPRVCGWVAGIPWVDLHLHDHFAERLAYRLYDAAYWKLQYALAEPHLNRVLRAAGLPARKSVTRDLWSCRLLLQALGRCVAQPRSSWPRQLVQTGFWFLPDDAFQPTPQLAEFLAAGAPPVVVSFGSTALGDPDRVTRELLAGAKAAGRRLLLIGGHAGIGRGALPHGAFHIDYLPFDWIFRRAESVLHHGGAGTTSLALRAGRPQAIAWQVADQRRWGATVFRLGAGARPIPIEQLDAHWVRSAIAACAEANVRARARELAQEIAGEDGIAVAIRHIERLSE